MKPNKETYNSPFLSHIPRKNNFETPCDYFKNIEKNVFQEIAIQKIHKGEDARFETPQAYFDNFEDLIIAKLKSEKRYKNSTQTAQVPADYFDQLEDRVCTKIKNQGKTIQFRSFIKSTLTPLAIAASLLLLFTLGNVNDANAVSFENISNTEIEFWVENGDLILNSEDFTAQLSDTAIELDSYNNIYTDEQALDFLKETDLENILFNDLNN